MRKRLLLGAIIIIVVLTTIIVFVVYSNQNYYKVNNYGSGPIDIEVVTDKSFYLQGEEINFTIYVTNPQDWNVPQPSSVVYDIKKDDEFIVGVDRNISFDGQPVFLEHSKILFDSRVWDQKVGSVDNQTFVQPGNYTFFVSFDGSVNYGNGGNCTFEIGLSSG